MVKIRSIRYKLLSYLGRGKYWHWGRPSWGGASPILSRGMGTLFSYLFLILLSTGGRVRNWSKLVEPSFTQWITEGGLYKMGEQILNPFFSSYAGRFSCSTI